MYIVYICALFFCIGSSMWIKHSILPFLMKKYVQKILIIVGLPIAYFVDELIAKDLLINAIGLPTRDFTMTILFLKFMFFIPTIAFICVFLVFVCCIITEILYIFFDILKTILNKIAYLFKFKQIINFSIDRKIYGRFIGVVLLSMFIYYMVIAIISYGFKFTNAIRLVAFYCDYQTMIRYPNVSKNERVILHENGVISSAKILNGSIFGEVVIEISMFKD